jgi:hypothetical protein
MADILHQPDIGLELAYNHFIDCREFFFNGAVKRQHLLKAKLNNW